MNTKKITTLLLIAVCISFIYSSCGHSRKMGCPGAITSIEKQKKHS